MLLIQIHLIDPGGACRAAWPLGAAEARSACSSPLDAGVRAGTCSPVQCGQYALLHLIAHKAPRGYGQEAHNLRRLMTSGGKTEGGNFACVGMISINEARPLFRELAASRWALHCNPSCQFSVNRRSRTLIFAKSYTDAPLLEGTLSDSINCPIVFATSIFNEGNCDW